MSESRPPSVDRLARSLADTGLPHPILVDVARQVITDSHPDDILDNARSLAEMTGRHLLSSVINATGVLLHTNLGRAPWGTTPDPTRYNTLEFDLETGERGSRHDRSPTLLALTCGAEAAIVVNNCASAVLLVLAALTQNKAAVISRGELIEIGGGFRIPEIMAQSGAQLIEIGTTNRTHRSDYSRAIQNNPEATMILKVHRSNYRIEGFTESVQIEELRGLGVPIVADIGSGLLDSTCPWVKGGPPSWLAGEPAARQTLANGADLVMFSGDKLLGGPQAGIIAGKSEFVSSCASHPLARALRPGALILNSLQDLALAYLRRDGDSIPFWRMATLGIESLRDRASKIAPNLAIDMASITGGGTLPGVEIPSVGLRLPGDRRHELRNNTPPIIGRISENMTLLDLRTVHPNDDPLLTSALEQLGVI